MKQRVVLALGGNAILQPNQEGTYDIQADNIRTCSKSLAKIIEADYELVIVHGNGPQVGQILRQNELASEEVPVQPLWACSAQSQGYIGNMIQEALKNDLPTQDVATILTRTEVSAEDPAFQAPTKPIGTFYTEEEAAELTKTRQWVMGEDAGRGYRRLVPSPKPIKIVEESAIKKMLAADIVVISTGGGGIPVVRENNDLTGVAAVIDKDLSALRLATDVEADVLMILTDVSNVYLNYGKPDQQKLETVPLADAEKYYAEGHFSDGSMGPKMEACIEFARQGKTAIICSIAEAEKALRGEAGTRVVSN